MSLALCVYVWRHVRDASHRTAEEDELAVLPGSDRASENCAELRRNCAARRCTSLSRFIICLACHTVGVSRFDGSFHMRLRSSPASEQR